MDDPRSLSSARPDALHRRSEDSEREGHGRPVRAPHSAADRLRAVAAAAAGVIGVGSREALRSVLEEACRRVIPFDAFSILAADAETHPSFGDPEAGRSESVIRRPILSGDEVLGILSVESDTPELYTAEDVEVVEVIASLAAAALSNLRLTGERDAAEEAFREREHQLREAQRIAHLGSWTWVVAGDRGIWSDELYRIYGLEPQAFGASFEAYLACVHPDDRTRVRSHIERALHTGAPFEFEERIVRPDGTVRVLRSSGEVTRDAGGRPSRLVGVCQDITEVKEAETALQRAHDELEQRVAARTAELAERTAELAQAEQRFRAIVEASPTPLLLSRIEDGVILYANDRLETLLGLPPGSLAGRKTPDFYFDPADRPKVIETVQRQGYARDLELRIRRADGTPRWVSLSVQRLVFDGEPALATALIDITERKRAEAALRTSEESYRGLFDNLTELVYIQSLEGHFLNVNEAVVRAYGYTREELIGQTPALLAAPGRVDAEDTLERFRRAAAGEGPQRFDWWGRRKDGSIFPKEVVLKRSTYFGQEVIIAVARDISERKRAEADLRLQKTLLEAQGEASIDGILVVSEKGKILSYNHRFVEMWSIPPEVVASRSDEAALQAVLDQLQDPAAFLARVERLYAYPDEEARDEIALRDGRVFDRYSAPVRSSEGDYYGRIWFFRDMTAQKRHAEELEQARQEAEHARIQASHYAKELERELEIGRQIQQGFLPAKLPRPPGWEITVRFSPAWQVAGDFYDVFELPAGRIGLVTADVCGKGVGAALFMALFQSLLRAYAERASVSSTGTSPSEETILIEAITATNGYITRVHKPAHMFASVFFGVLDPEVGTLRYVNAGHEPPVVIGRDGPRARLTPTGPALGLLPEAPFEVGRTMLGPGELFLAFTDGVTEARSAERDFFTEERLLAQLHRPAPTADSLLDRIEQALRDFTGEAPPSDDLTLLAVRRGEG